MDSGVRRTRPCLQGVTLKIHEENLRAIDSVTALQKELGPFEGYYENPQPRAVVYFSVIMIKC